MKKLLLLGLIILMTGCGGAKKLSAAMESWVGSHKSELILAWGPPTSIDSDGLDGEVYTYSKSTNVSLYQPAYGSILGLNETYKSYRRFFIDEEGIVYNWSWKGL